MLRETAAEPFTSTTDTPTIRVGALAALAAAALAVGRVGATETVGRREGSGAMRSTIRTLCRARIGFAILWVSLLSAVHPHDGTVNGFADVLLIAYPISDAVATAVDLHREPTRAVRAAQTVNLLASTATACAVAAIAPHRLSGAMDVFAGWAIIAGVIQMAVGALRLGRVDGQWPMILSGAGSSFAGTTFLDWTGTDTAALHALIPYSIGGAIWYTVTAAWLLFTPPAKPSESTDEPSARRSNSRVCGVYIVGPAQGVPPPRPPRARRTAPGGLGP